MRRHPKAAAVGSTLGSGSSRARRSVAWPGLALVLLALAAMALAPMAQAAPTRAELPALSKLSAAGTGNIESGSDLVKGVATTTGAFEVGQYFAGPFFGIPAGTKILALPSPTELKLSTNATETAAGVSISSSWVESFACGAATDSEGNYYVGSGASFGTTRITIYKPDGTQLTDFATTGPTCNLAVDSLGRIYATKLGGESAVMRYKPSALPVTASTTYAPDTALNGSGELLTGGANSVAVDPSNDHVFVAEASVNEVQKLTKEGSPTGGTFRPCLHTGKASGTTTASSNEITGLATSFGGFKVRDEISGTGIPAGTTVVAAGAGTLTLSAAATASGVAADLLATECPVATGVADLTASSKILKAVTTATGNFVVGAQIEGTGIPATAIVSKIISATELEISVAVAAGGTASGLSIASKGMRSAASAANLQSALRGLPGVGGTGVLVTGTAPYSITFGAPFASLNVDQMTCDGSGLTPVGASCSVATNTQGAGPRISAYESSGSLITSAIGSAVPGAKYFDVDVYGANGRVYATDVAHNKALVFEAGASVPVSEIDGSGSAACTKGAFTGMVQTPLAVDQSNGNVLISDIRGNGVVDEFNAAGKCLATVAHLPAFEEGAQGDIAIDDSATAGRGNAYILSSPASTRGSVYAYDAPVPTKTLATSVTPAGSGTVLCNGTSVSNPLAACASSYAESSSIALNAVPSAGFKFKEWKNGSGSATACNGSKTSTCTVELAANSEVTAEFELAGFKLTVSKNGTGTGKVTSAPAGIDCGSDCEELFAENTLVSLTPAPDPGSSFKAWGGNCAGSGACEVTMSAAKNVSATFVASPTVTTTAGATNITPKKADVAGTVNPNGTQVDAASCKVQYGETIAYGQTAPCVPADPGAGSSPVAVSASLSGLNPGATYHFRFTASNEGGVNVGNGSDQAFATAALLAPVVETKAASGIGKLTATLNGSVNPKLENVTECKFEYGLSAPAYGQTAPCVPASPGSGNSPVAVSAAVSGLTADTTYHFRLVATNGGGTTNGGDLTLKTAADEKPAVTSLTPSKGPTAGTNQVIVAGINFTGATEVKFGAASATFTVNSPTQIKATAPGGSAGSVDVIVTTPEGASTNTPADDYTYLLPPSVTAVSPNKGPLTAGTVVTVTGTNLQEASFKFGANPATSVVVNGGGTSATMNAPGGSAGAVDVIATTLGGSSSNTPADDYTYLAAPILSNCNPTKGPLTAGTAVTCTGTNLAEASFKFGANAATSVVVNGGGTSATMNAPAGSAGTVDITATTAGGTSAPTVNAKFTYLSPPTVTGVSPNKGPLAAGNAVTVTGTNLQEASFKFGANPATSVVVNGGGTSATMSAPAGSAGAVDVIATTLGGSSSNTPTDDYTYQAVPPSVTAVSPSKGPLTAGNAVTVTGTNLSGAAFKFGANSATSVVVNGTGTSATMNAPGGSAGTVDVIATTLEGSSTNTPADDYTYLSPPTVTGISPIKGPTAGGNVVTITGTNLNEASFKFGAGTATEVNITGGGTGATVKAPSGPPGTVSVIATTLGGSSTNTPVDDYTYVVAPTVTGISPIKGPTAGGNVVTITGTNLSGASFKFGTNAATEVIITGGGTGATVKAPAGSAGIVSVIATIPGGVSTNTAADDYAYLAPSALTIEKAGGGSGSVSCDGGPCAASYPYGSEVTLNAAAAAGSSFAGWSGGGCAGAGACTVTIEADTTVTASFTVNPTPPPTPEAAGTLKIAAKAPVSSGKAALTISCTGEGPCKGSLKLTAKIGGKKKTIGSASYDLAAGKSATVKVKLSAAAKKLLKEGKTIKATLSGSGVKGTVKLRPAKKSGGR